MHMRSIQIKRSFREPINLASQPKIDLSPINSGCCAYISQRRFFDPLFSYTYALQRCVNPCTAHTYEKHPGMGYPTWRNLARGRQPYERKVFSLFRRQISTAPEYRCSDHQFFVGRGFNRDINAAKSQGLQPLACCSISDLGSTATSWRPDRRRDGLTPVL